MSGRVPVWTASRGERAASPRAFASDGFAGYVAHELRTPLATQRALLELALADRTAEVADWREIGEDVLRACRQQERLLEACLALSMSELGPRQCKPVDLAAIAAATLRAHDLNMFESVVTCEPASTTGDPDLVERLVANLISNAIRHNVVGGRIEVTTHTRSKHAVLTVSNTGPLVPPHELPRLFQPFQRLGPNSSSRRDGNGLGLAIVAAIAATHNAIVSAKARPDGGLEVEIGFPAPKRELERTKAQ